MLNKRTAWVIFLIIEIFLAIFLVTGLQMIAASAPIPSHSWAQIGTMMAFNAMFAMSFVFYIFFSEEKRRHFSYLSCQLWQAIWLAVAIYLAVNGLGFAAYHSSQWPLRSILMIVPSVVGLAAVWKVRHWPTIWSTTKP